MMQAGYVFPASVMLHAKALTTAEALFFELAPDVRYEQLSRLYIAWEYAAHATAPETLAKRASQILPELLLLGELPPLSVMDEDWDWAATNSLAHDLLSHLGLANAGAGRNILRQLVERHARPVLDSLEAGLNVSETLNATRRRYDALEAGLPAAETVGAMLTTHLAALTLAIHESLLAQGLSNEAGQQILYDIGWSIYERMSELPLLLAKTLTSSPEKQMCMATDLFRLFSFGSPAYGWHDADVGPNIVGFDCTKCPIAEFFSSMMRPTSASRLGVRLITPRRRNGAGTYNGTGLSPWEKTSAISDGILIQIDQQTNQV